MFGFLLFIYSDLNAGNIDSIKIDSLIYKLYYGRDHDPVPTVDDVYNLISRGRNNITISECERHMISCADKIYDSVISDTNHVDIIQARIIDDVLWSFDKSSRYNENIEKFYYKLYNSNYSRFIRYSSIMLFKYSNNWFQLANNVIDSMNIKYGEQRITLYRELIDMLKNTDPGKNDSIKYMAYKMINQEWTVFRHMDSIFTEKEPSYARSYQRLNFAKRIDSELVKIKARENKNYEKINSDLDLFKKGAPYAYKIYQMLKKQKNLTNYTPPVLDSMK